MKTSFFDMKTKQQQGSSLLEVLVAILIFSFGLLGMAGLSTASIGYNKTAQVRNVGVMLVNDLAERARINVAGFDQGAYNIAVNAAIPNNNPNMPNTPNVVDAVGASNAARALANFDTNYWLRQVNTRLPGNARAVVITTPNPVPLNANAERNMDIWLVWSEQDESMLNSMWGANSSGKCPAGVANGSNCMYFRVAL